MADSIGELEHRLLRIANDAVSPAALARVGKAGAKDATGAIRSAITDTSMSHFSRKSPVDLAVKSWVTDDHTIVFGPEKKAIGPSVVLNSGHKSYVAGDRRLTGKVSKKTGKALSRKVKRSTTGHAGKGTADKGHQLIVQRTSARLHDELVKVLRREFRG